MIAMCWGKIYLKLDGEEGCQVWTFLTYIVGPRYLVITQFWIPQNCYIYIYIYIYPKKIKIVKQNYIFMTRKDKLWSCKDQIL
jgi:hypothetical protein